VIDECFAVVEPLLGTARAWVATGRSRAMVYRRRRGPRVTVRRPRPAPPSKLTEVEVEEILGTLRSPQFVDCSPAQVDFTLLDEGTYLASESSFYRIQRAHASTSERRCQATHPARTRPELVAHGPLPVWSWGITKLRGPKRSLYYELSVVIDIFSRSVVAWCVALRERGAGQ
jgi:putative transposase